MKRRKAQILFLAFILTSCVENINNGDLKVHETIIKKAEISREDSNRMIIGLLPLDSNWLLDTIEYGILDSGSNIWTEIKDTSNYSSFLIKKIMVSNKNSGVALMKGLKFDPKENKLIREWDIYKKFNDDSSLSVSVTISYNYINQDYYCFLDTIDYNKRKRADIELKEHQNKWKKMLEDSKKDGLIPDGTWYQRRNMEILNSYFKLHPIDKDEALDIINKQFTIE